MARSWWVEGDTAGLMHCVLSFQKGTWPPALGARCDLEEMLAACKVVHRHEHATALGSSLVPSALGRLDRSGTSCVLLLGRALLHRPPAMLRFPASTHAMGQPLKSGVSSSGES